LKSAGEPAASDLMRLQCGDVVAVEDNPSARCRQRAADEIEERGLAGAVGTDNAGDRTRCDRNIDLVDGA
jgi:hypothetical protein